MDSESLDACYTHGNALWHMDMLVLECPVPAMLLARELPPKGGGSTQFAVIAGTWRRLPPKRKRELRGLRAAHHGNDPKKNGNHRSSRATERAWPGEHPLVCLAPIRQANTFSLAPTSHVLGIPGEHLRVELQEIATQDNVVDTLAWRPHDLLLWSNRRAMHRVLPYADRGERRCLWRLEVVSDVRPVPSKTGGRLSSVDSAIGCSTASSAAGS